MAKDNPTIMVEYKAGKLVPVNPIDAELLDAYPNGSLFELKDSSVRDTRQNNRYWLMLNRIVEATGRWTTAYHLHQQLLIRCGLYSSVQTLDGGIRIVADSTAFKAMKPKDFTQYNKRAEVALAEAGIDIDAVMTMEAA